MSRPSVILSLAKDLAPMFIGFALLVGFILLFYNAQAASAPEGWHDAANSNNITGPIVWPASNTPARVDLFTWTCSTVFSNAYPGGTGTSCVNIVSNTWKCCRQTATNTYAGYGLYAQLTNCIFTNFFWLTTSNYYQLVTNGGTEATNDLGGPFAKCTNGYNLFFVPTNASYGIATNSLTNWIGVANAGRTPTNQCGVCVIDARSPLTCLTNVNAAGGIVLTTNSFINNALLSGDSIDRCRWALLSPYGNDGYSPGAGTWRTASVERALWANAWYQSDLYDKPDPYYGLPAVYPLAIAMPTYLTGSGLQTNWYLTNPLLTNGWISLFDPLSDDYGSWYTNYWQQPYAATNLALNTEELQLLDLYFALRERAEVFPAYWMWVMTYAETYEGYWEPPVGMPSYRNQQLQGFQQSLRQVPYLGQRTTEEAGQSWMTPTFGRRNRLQSLKSLALWLSAEFVRTDFADSNTVFDTWFSQPMTNWTWNGTVWTPAVAYRTHFPRWTAAEYFYYSSGLYHPIFTDYNWMSGEDFFATFSPWYTALDAVKAFNLPHGYLTTTIATNVLRYGWEAGNTNTYEVTNSVSVIYSNQYGNYFLYSPSKVLATNHLGEGHIVTGIWELVNLWGVTNFAARVFETKPFDFGGATDLGWLANALVRQLSNNFCFGGNLGAIVTNPLPAPCNTLGIYPNKEIADTVFLVLSNKSSEIVTNCVTGLTNGIDCTLSGTNNGRIVTNLLEMGIRGVHRQMTRTGLSTYTTNDTTVFSWAVSSAINSTNFSLIVTNYDVAEGWREIDYGPDGLRTFINQGLRASSEKFVSVWGDWAINTFDAYYEVTNYLPLTGIGVFAAVGEWATQTNCINEALYQYDDVSLIPYGFQEFNDCTNRVQTNNLTAYPMQEIVGEFSLPTYDFYQLEQSAGAWKSRSVLKFWSSSPPVNAICGGTNNAFTHLAGPIVAKNGEAANAGYATVPTVPDAHTILGRSSFAVVYPAIYFSNSTPRADLYVQPSRPALGGMDTVRGGQAWPQPLADTSAAGALIATNSNTYYTTGSGTGWTNICNELYRSFTFGCGFRTGVNPPQFTAGFAPVVEVTYNVTGFPNQVTYDPGPHSGMDTVGMFQRVATVSAATNPIMEFVTDAVELTPTLNENPKGWAVGDKKVLIIWDADPTNGFKYHQ